MNDCFVEGSDFEIDLKTGKYKILNVYGIKNVVDIINKKDKEIKRLNNIINEFDKDVKIRIDFYKQEIKEFQDDLSISNYEEIEDVKNEIKIRRYYIKELEDILDKLQELKEDLENEIN